MRGTRLPYLVLLCLVSVRTCRFSPLWRWLATSVAQIGALRLYLDDKKLLPDRGVDLVSKYFHAVKHVFADVRERKSPKTSRLAHGAGIISMGYVMEALRVMTGAGGRESSARELRHLKDHTAWSSDKWAFRHECRRWNSLQNVPSDIRQLSMHIMQELKWALPPAVEAV